jgi:phosphoglycerate kinase
MGVFENDAYSNGTKLIAENLSKITEDGVCVIAGGGDTLSALKHLDLIEKFTHVSTGGGSSLELMSGKNLMALERLKV